MRLIANVSTDVKAKRLMLYECDQGVYLFLYEIEEDGSCFEDVWFERVDDAREWAKENYNVLDKAWSEILEPLLHCQHDWIMPARVPGHDLGNPQWDKLEIWQDGVWVDKGLINK